MSDTLENMIVDCEDTPSQPVDRTGKRGLEQEGCEGGEIESVLLNSSLTSYD